MVTIGQFDLKFVRLIYTIHPSKWNEQQVVCRTMVELVKFFHEWKVCGELVGYVITKNRPKAFNDETFTGELALEWEDKFGYGKKGFANVWDLADFLDEQKILASRLEYVRKAKHKP
jgi:hypothetical protein